MTNDEKLEKKNWSKEAQELDDFYSDKYFQQSTCIIPFGGIGANWIFMSCIAQFSNFYHDGKLFLQGHNSKMCKKNIGNHGIDETIF